MTARVSRGNVERRLRNSTVGKATGFNGENANRHGVTCAEFHKENTRRHALSRVSDPGRRQSEDPRCKCKRVHCWIHVQSVVASKTRLVSPLSMGMHLLLTIILFFSISASSTGWPCNTAQKLRTNEYRSISQFTCPDLRNIERRDSTSDGEGIEQKNRFQWNLQEERNRLILKNLPLFGDLLNDNTLTEESRISTATDIVKALRAGNLVTIYKARSKLSRDQKSRGRPDFSRIFSDRDFINHLDDFEHSLYDNMPPSLHAALNPYGYKVDSELSPNAGQTEEEIKENYTKYMAASQGYLSHRSKTTLEQQQSLESGKQGDNLSDDPDIRQKLKELEVYKNKVKVETYSDAILAGFDWGVPPEHMVDRLDLIIRKAPFGLRLHAYLDSLGVKWE